MKFIILGAAALIFFAIPALLSNTKTSQDISERVASLKKDIPTVSRAKISTPPQEKELEKTIIYGDLYCNDFEKNELTKKLFENINRDRELNNKKSLEWSELLCESAKLKSADLIINNYFEHVSPSGLAPKYFIEKAGYKYTYSGENLALNYYTADTTHEALMNSQGHRENILNENFTEVGLGYWRGKIDGQEAFVIVQHFGAPAPEVPLVKYVCETKKAEKTLKELKKTKKEIDERLDEAEDIKKDIKKAGQDTDEVNDYIDDLEDEKKKFKKYVKETEDYLDKCKEYK